MSEVGAVEESQPSPEKTLAEGNTALENLYSEVEPGSIQHRALLHLIAYETLKHQALTSQARLREAQEDVTAARSLDTPDMEVVKVLEGVQTDEETYWHGRNRDIENVMQIIIHTREADENYRAMSVDTEGIVRNLESDHERLGTDKPFATVSMTLRDINERQVPKPKPKPAM